MKKIFTFLLALMTLSSCGNNHTLCPVCQGEITMGSTIYQRLIKLTEQDDLNLFEMTEVDSEGNFNCHSFGEEGIHNVYSVSKNFTATAAGILYDQGKLSFDENVYDLFKDEYAMDETWKDVKVHHVLTQTIGIEEAFLDVDNDDRNTFEDRDYLKIVLNHVPTKTPGTLFLYSDSNYYLLGKIISKKTGMKLQDFLIENVFKPLEITCYDFDNDPDGQSMAATGMMLNSHALAALGKLYLDNGIYKGKRIVSEEFVKLATSKLVRIDPNTCYGYSFWLDEGKEMFRMSGMYAQCVYVDKKNKTVIAWTADDRGSVVNELLEELQSTNF